MKTIENNTLEFSVVSFYQLSMFVFNKEKKKIFGRFA